MGSKKTLADFAKDLKNVWGDRYTISPNTVYVNTHTKLKIICKKHGEFDAEPNSLLHGHGCKKCRAETVGKDRVLKNEDVINNIKKIHGDKYDLSKIDYVNARTKITPICKKHGMFYIRYSDLMNGHGCPICSSNISNPENEIYEFVKQYFDDAIHNDKTIISPLEIDIFIPSINVGIEYNGLRWHSEEFQKDKNYHLNKLNKCNEKGIKLIQIFEDEYIENKSLVKEKILHILGVNNNLPKIMGRKCTINEINKEEAEVFLTKNHIQGFASSSIYLGCFYNDLLVGVMSFLKEKEGYWNLTRFASNNEYICNGIGGKLFKYFTKKYDPIEVKSFADRRWTTNPEDNLYIKLNFKLTNILRPDYRYVFRKEYGLKRVHKFNFRKQHLNRKYGLPLTMTESEMTEALGAYKIWDCGLFKYVWKKE